MIDDILPFMRCPAMARLRELMEQVPPAELTTTEVLAIVAVLESADQRVNAPCAPVLQLTWSRD